MIKLKISEQEKYANDGQWFKDFMNETVPLQFTQSEDYEAMMATYRVVNNDLSDFKKLMDYKTYPLAS